MKQFLRRAGLALPVLLAAAAAFAGDGTWTRDGYDYIDPSGGTGYGPLVPMVTPRPSGSAAIGITPVVSGAAEASHVLKNAPGNLYSLYVTTGGTAGFLLTFNATSAPADGAVTPVDCLDAPANFTTGISVNGGAPDVYSTGIVAVFSTTGCFTKTASATAFFKGRVQ